MTTLRHDFLEKAIPKKIHFIWIGGSIPEDYLKSIEKLAEIAKRDGFELNVWVDNKENILKAQNKMHFKKSEERTKKISIVDYDLQNPNFRIRHIDELMERMETDDFYLRNQDVKKSFIKFLRSEMVGLKNLGAAADMLRYEILRQEGGTYLDADTKLFIDAKTKLTQELSLLGFRANMRARREGMEKEGGFDQLPEFDENGNPMKFPDKHYQIPEGVKSSRVWIDPTREKTPEILKNEGTENGNVCFHGGNDIISSVPEHPLLQSLIIKMVNAYKWSEISPASSKEKAIMRLTKHPQHQLPTTQLDSKRFPVGKDEKQFTVRFEYTLKTSGPARLEAVMESYFKEQSNHSLDALFSLQLESRYLGSSPIEQLKQKQIGMDVQTRSDKTWLKKAKKIQSFSTERMSDTIFAQRFNKKLNEESSKKISPENSITKTI